MNFAPYAQDWTVYSRVMIPFRPRTQNNPESRNIVSMRGNSISSSDRCKRHLGTENRGGGWGEVTHTFSQLFIYLIITTATFGPIKKGKSQSIGVLFPDFSVHWSLVSATYLARQKNNCCKSGWCNGFNWRALGERGRGGGANGIYFPSPRSKARRSPLYYVFFSGKMSARINPRGGNLCPPGRKWHTTQQRRGRRQRRSTQSWPFQK